MSDPINNPPNFNPSPGAIWPPPPQQTTPQAPPQLDIRAIDNQNCWLLLLLLVVTCWMYTPFWMMKTAKSINRIAPDYAISIPVLWTLFGLLAVNLGGAIIGGAIEGATGSTSTTFETFSRLFGFGVGIFQLVVVFQIKDALNQILWRTFPRNKRFSSLGAFFFGALSLQIEINQFSREMAKPGFTPNGFYPQSNT